MSEDKRVIVCNYTEGTNIASEGAKVYVAGLNPGSGNDRIRVLARSRSGIFIHKWENIRRLTNFRFTTIPVGHPMYGDERIAGHYSQETLGHLVDAKTRATAVLKEMSVT